LILDLEKDMWKIDVDYSKCLTIRHVYIKRLTVDNIIKYIIALHTIDISKYFPSTKATYFL